MASSLDTIAALATAPGSAALAVIRVSGEDSLEIVNASFEGRDLTRLRGFQGAVGRVVGSSGALDEVVAWVYRAPHSYTGEDSVEISCHGGRVSADLILSRLRESGARPAEPGEFSRRAFLNGRMDLAQAEAVAGLIAARGRRAQGIALAQLAGGLSRRMEELVDPLRGVLARLTVFLDFDEDVPEPPDTGALSSVLDEVRSAIAGLRQTADAGSRLREGFRVALVGRPNVGKSSLLNALAGFDRAIVHHAPGTTRDVVDIEVEWSGIPVRILDTAGIREGADAVESVGMGHTQRELDRADLVVWVVDGSRSPGAGEERVAGLLEGRRHAVVLNKMDLGLADAGCVSAHSPVFTAMTSALTGKGISQLRDWLRDALSPAVPEQEEGLALMHERHAHALQRAEMAVAQARAILASGQPVELAAADLHQALAALGEVTGDNASEDLLDTIFQNFCIGK